MKPSQAGPDPLGELFGLLACIRLAAFEERAGDAAHAGSYEDRVVLGGLAAGAFQQFERLRDRLVELGRDPGEAIAPYRGPLAEYHRRTRPADSAEALAKVYVADGVLADFYMDSAGRVDEAARELVRDSLADSGHAELLTARIRAAAEADSRLAARLGLWTRRLIGEVLSQVHAVVAARPVLAELAGPEGVEAMFGQVIDRHAARMREIDIAE